MQIAKKMSFLVRFLLLMMNESSLEESAANWLNNIRIGRETREKPDALKLAVLHKRKLSLTLKPFLLFAIHGDY